VENAKFQALTIGHKKCSYSTKVGETMSEETFINALMVAMFKNSWKKSENKYPCNLCRSVQNCAKVSYITFPK
jgi:hypothetical protein